MPHPRGEVVQRRDQARPVPARSRPTDTSSSARTSSRATRRPTSTTLRGTLWSWTKRTGCATSTSRRTSSPTRSSRRWPQAPKLLLTATPLQNSLLELFGLVSIIDDQVFGDLKSFREQFSDLTQEQVFAHAEAPPRAALPSDAAAAGHGVHLVHAAAAARRAVHAGRVAKTGSTTSVSEYLRRDNLQALPSSQRTLMTLVMRKLLASSYVRHRRRARDARQTAEGQARREQTRRSRSRRNSTRITRRSTRRPRSGRTTSRRPPLSRSRPRGPGSAKSRTSSSSATWRPRSRTTPRARRC